jgi:hypothetical protein
VGRVEDRPPFLVRDVCFHRVGVVTEVGELDERARERPTVIEHVHRELFPSATEWICTPALSTMRPTFGCPRSRTPYLAVYRDERLKVVTGPTVMRELSVLSHAIDTGREVYSPLVPASWCAVRPKGALEISRILAGELLDEVSRPPLGFHIYLPDVFPDDADAEKLNAAKEVHR